VNLVRRDRRSPKQSKSYVSKGTLLCRACRPVLALHHTVIGCGTAECNAIPLIVGASAGEGAAPRHAALEVVDMRRFEVWPSRLVVTAILVQPWDWVGVGPSVRSGWGFGCLLTPSPRAGRKGHTGESTGCQEFSPVADLRKGHSHSRNVVCLRLTAPCHALIRFPCGPKLTRFASRDAAAMVRQRQSGAAFPVGKSIKSNSSIQSSTARCACSGPNNSLTA